MAAGLISIVAVLPGAAQELERLAARPSRFLRMARRMGLSPEDAEDAVQEAMLTAFAKLHLFQGRSKLSTWVGRIVINAVLMSKRPKRMHVAHLPLDAPASMYPEVKFVDLLTADTPSPECAAIASERLVQALFVMQGMPISYRRALQMQARCDGARNVDQAQELGISVGTFKAYLSKGRARLREQAL